MHEINFGFYVFLGIGDYHKPKTLNNKWFGTWKLEEWKSFLIKLKDLNVNTLMVYMNGHSLSYESKYFSEIVDHSHPNVKQEFFSKVLAFAKELSINIILVLTTTGHSGKYSERNPHLKIVPRPLYVDLEKLLLPFPVQIRKRKNIVQRGNAQIGFGTLCHNHPQTRKYATRLIDECLEMYPAISGVALHPPESIYPCFCEICKIKFYDKYHKKLYDVSDKVAREFYLETYLQFQNEYLEELIKYKYPQLTRYTFTVPWLFENSFTKIEKLIEKDTIIIDWDYNLDLCRINKLGARLSEYQRYGHKVWFMPSARIGFFKEDELSSQINKVKQQIQNAINANIAGIIPFIGPVMTINIKKLNTLFNFKK